MKNAPHIAPSSASVVDRKAKLRAMALSGDALALDILLAYATIEAVERSLCSMLPAEKPVVVA